ncbi:MAG TPA: glycine cleavage system aminomethyltransferase GcvT [Rhodospirillales bacterium]|nr:glycine cleavage system aminomethyltransferase GcvT [Rhodospirillales bacterium]
MNGGVIESETRRTPLYDLHRRLGARMVPFAGYSMPLHYPTGILAEHLQARAKAVVFDVSHMGQVRIEGDAGAALERLVVADVADLPAGKVKYTMLTNDAGGIIDDLMLTPCGTHLMLVINASRKAIDVAHLRRHLPDHDVRLLDDQALLALQGPAAAMVLGRLAPASKLMLFMTSEALRLGDIRCTVARSGYTGEDGCEISCAASDAPELARLLLAEPEVAPAGLGARDTLRLEAGLCLWGNDIDETTTPVEAGLGWAIGKRRREQGGFLGDEVVLRQLFAGPERRRVGIRLAGKAPARAGTPIHSRDGAPIGVVTSGGYGPSLASPVAMGYVAVDSAPPGTRLSLPVRGKALDGEVVRLPFVAHRYVKQG